MLLIKNETGVFLLPLLLHFEMDRIDITHLSNKVTDDGKTVVTVTKLTQSVPCREETSVYYTLSCFLGNV